MHAEEDGEERILVLAPRGRDAQVIRQVLARDGVSCAACADYRELLRELDSPAGAAIIAEEALSGADIRPLIGWLARQASWSDFPFVVLVSQFSSQAGAAYPQFRSVGNVVLLERPINAETLRSAAASALRARRRQYQARRDLQELARSEERLRIAQQAGGIGSFEVLPASGDFLPSEQFCRLWGMPVAPRYRISEFLALLHPEDRRSLDPGGQESPWRGTGYTEYRILRPDTGEVRWIARHGELVTDTGSDAPRYVGVVYDITQRKRTEQNLRFLAEASAALTMLAEPQQKMDRLAALAVVGFADWCAVDIREADGAIRRIALACAERDAHEPEQHFARCFPQAPYRHGGPWNVMRSGQAELIRQMDDGLLPALVDGAERRAAMQELGFKSYLAVPLAVQGKTLGAITFVSARSARWYNADDLALAEDLGRRAAVALENANLYRGLQEADRGKDIFLATLSHELRNPLAAITNGINVIRLGADDREKVRRSTLLMERQASQLRRLVDDLMDISRITTGKLELRRQHASLVEILENAIEASRHFVEAEAHTLSVRCPDEPLEICADPTRLSQVFSNLISNAAKYMDRGGTIDITVECEPSQFVVRVADTGIGIAPERLKSIFVMFEQESHPLDRSKGGLGIGLSLVEGLVRLHGGSVSAASAGPGKGSEFTIRLPREAPGAIVAASGEAPAIRVADSRRPGILKVLVVDDNVDAAIMLAEALRLLGNQVETVHDGVAAVTVVEGMKPDIVLLDIGLPGMDGYEVARTIKSRAQTRATVLIALTGWGQDKDRQRAAEAGFDEHWVKPVQLEQLRRMSEHYRRVESAPSETAPKPR